MFMQFDILVPNFNLILINFNLNLSKDVTFEKVTKILLKL